MVLPAHLTVRIVTTVGPFLLKRPKRSVRLHRDKQPYHYINGPGLQT